MEQPPQQGEAAAPQPPAQGQPAATWTEEALKVAFSEYQLLMDGTDKITDRRQTANTLFVSINALFLTGVGYLLFQSFHNIATSGWFILGFFIIAVLMQAINNTWRKLSNSYSRLVNLRIRYLKQLELQLHVGGVFPYVETPLENDELVTDPTKSVVERGKSRAIVDRGTYQIENVLYNNPETQKEEFGFSHAEQRIGRIFTAAYWLAFVAPAIACAVANWPQILQLLRQIGLPV